MDLVLHPDDLVEQHYPELIRDGDALVAEVEVGGGRWLWGKATPLYDSRMRIVGAIEMCIRDRYLRVQQAKSEVLLDFYSDLVAHAKEAGAKKVGIMPWFFIPTIENTPPNTLNTSCNIGEIAQIPGLDLLVARMQPDNIYVNTMRTGDELQTSPVLYYFEVMAHSMGKDLITVTNPTDEYTDYPACPLTVSYTHLDVYKRQDKISQHLGPPAVIKARAFYLQLG